MSSPVFPDVRLSIDSLPTVDLRLLSQSDLTALSLCSAHAFDLRRCDDVVIPQIDRAVFNESAGSRKQTYSRLRLAPRNTAEKTTMPPSHNKPPPAAPLDSDNSRIISLFKTLFNNKNNNNEEEEEEEEDTETETETEETRRLLLSSSSALVPVHVEYSDVPGLRKRKPAGDTLRNANNTTTTTKAVAERDEEKEKELRNKNGEVVDLKELGKKEDPYGKEIRRRTEGKDTAEELIGFVNELQGQWGSRRKKRKIVDANGFGDALPNGWKLAIAIKKKQGRAWLFCRRYIRSNMHFFFVIALDCN